MPALAYFLFKDLLHDRWRSLLTILNLAVIVVGYLLLGSLAQSIAILSKSAPASNDLLIVEADTIDPMDSTIDEAALQAAMDIAPMAIRRAIPILFRHLTIDGQVMQVRGVTTDELPLSQRLILVGGGWPDGPRQVVVSEGAARLASWKIGSMVNIYGTNFQICGLVRAEENAFGSIWMTYPDAQQLFGAGKGFQVGYLSLAASANAENVRTSLQADPRISSAYTVYLQSAYNDSYNQSNASLVILSSLMVLISLLAISFGTYNATSLSLAERGPEIGVLRAIGFTPDKLRYFLLARSLLLTLAAYSLGWAVSRLLIAGQQHKPAVDIIFLNLHLTSLSSLIGLGLAVLFAFLGVWLMLGRLSAMNPLAERH
jgi:ABC-type antimicrobial peptide transport system permease subunit